MKLKKGFTVIIVPVKNRYAFITGFERMVVSR